MPVPKKAKISVPRNDQVLLPLSLDCDGGSLTHRVPSLLSRHTFTLVSKGLRIFPLLQERLLSAEKPPEPARYPRYHPCTQVLSVLLNKPQMQQIPNFLLT